MRTPTAETRADGVWGTCVLTASPIEGSSTARKEPKGTVGSGVAVSKAEGFRGASGGQAPERGSLAGGMTSGAVGMALWAVGSAGCQSSKLGGSD